MPRHRRPAGRSNSTVAGAVNLRADADLILCDLVSRECAPSWLRQHAEPCGRGHGEAGGGEVGHTHTYVRWRLDDSTASRAHVDVLRTSARPWPAWYDDRGPWEELCFNFPRGSPRPAVPSSPPRLMSRPNRTKHTHNRTRLAGHITHERVTVMNWPLFVPVLSRHLTESYERAQQQDDVYMIDGAKDNDRERLDLSQQLHANQE
jgi:hypothetical protein